MMVRRLDVDCVVIGGGAVGTLSAMMLAERGERCLVLRLSDRQQPEAETLRNQAWLQSGALFSRLPGEEVPSVLARRLRLQGQRLLSGLDLALPKTRGLARFPEAHEDEIETFIDDARALGLGNVVRRIDASQARAALGKLHREDTVCIEVPDAPFDEAKMLLRARIRAMAAGAIFRELDQPVGIEPGPRERSWQLVIDNERYIVPKLVLAAGVGNLALLDALGIHSDLAVKRTPLLVIPRTEQMTAPILIDRSQKLAVACHQRRHRQPDGCLVAGAYVGAKVGPEHLQERSIPREDWQKIYDVLPSSLQPRQGDGHRFTCGYEVMRTGERRVRKEDLMVEHIEGYNGIVLALPGRATLAYHAAELVLRAFDHEMRPEQASRPDARSDLEVGEAWAGPINMHHDSSYDHLDERAKEAT